MIDDSPGRCQIRIVPFMSEQGANPLDIFTSSSSWKKNIATMLPSSWALRSDLKFSFPFSSFATTF